MSDQRILTNASGETARINLASAGRYAVALGRQTLQAPTVEELHAKAAPLGWTPVETDAAATERRAVNKAERRILERSDLALVVELAERFLNEGDLADASNAERHPYIRAIARLKATP